MTIETYHKCIYTCCAYCFQLDPNTYLEFLLYFLLIERNLMNYSKASTDLCRPRSHLLNNTKLVNTIQVLIKSVTIKMKYLRNTEMIYGWRTLCLSL